jgi:hypothetical protein
MIGMYARTPSPVAPCEAILMNKRTLRYMLSSRTSETRPAVGPTLLKKVLETASLGSGIEQLSRIGIVEIDFTCFRLGVINKGGLLKVAAVLGVVTVVVADAIGRVSVAFPAKILLDRNLKVIVVVGEETKIVREKGEQERANKVKRSDQRRVPAQGDTINNRQTAS